MIAQLNTQASNCYCVFERRLDVRDAARVERLQVSDHHKLAMMTSTQSFMPLNE